MTVQRRMRAAALAALALALAPEAAAMGLGNAAPSVVGISLSPSPVPASSTAAITCAATDDGGVAKLAFTVTGGSLAGGSLSQTVDLQAPQPSATATVAWSTPAPGSYDVTCAATDAGGTFGGVLTSSQKVTVVVEAVAEPPGIDALEADVREVAPGGVVHLSATAHGDGLSFAWSAAGGTLDASGPSATWTAPGQAGEFAIALTVTDASGRSATATLRLSVVWARQGAAFDGATPGAVFLPAGIAVDGAGTSWVANPRRGELVAFSRDGAVLRRVAVGGWPSAVATGPDGSVFVGDLASGGGVRVLSAVGAQVRTLGAGGALPSPTAIAVHPVTGQAFVGDSTLGAVVVFDAAGRAAAAIALGGAAPAGVALDPARGRLYVSDSRSGRVLVFTVLGAPIGAFGSYGAPITRGGGVAVGPDGNVYVVDTYQAHVVVLSPAGAPLAYLGAAVGTPGALDVPLGVAADPRGVVRVTSTQTGTVESYALAGFSAPSCPGDSDCDGMPDAWELAHGLDPFNPLDAGADPDGDGLTNLAEYQHGTDPRAWDTDGDGASDGAEVAAGDDPLDPRDHAPLLLAGAARTSDPGLVRLGATLDARGTCSVAWRQVEGPPVELRGASTLSPSFVARVAASYRLEGVATCSRGTSAPAHLDATVRPVPPRPDAGRTLVAHLGDRVALDGRFSWDANGDALALAWDQTLGPPVSGAVAGATPELHATRRGLLSFQLTATDPVGLASHAEVPVLVVDSGLSPPRAEATSPVVGEVGAEIRLDASASAAERGVDGFAWRQVAGPEVSLQGGGATPRFTPGEPGVYAFEVSALAGGLRSPPSRVEVYVAPAGTALPTAAAVADPATAQVGQPVTLDGSASASAAGPLVHRWRQVSGPAAGLTDADRAVATVVPFAPGVLVFELAVSANGAPGLPARVTLVAGAPGASFPVAVPSSVATARQGDLVPLDGSASLPAGGVSGYRWTQVGGPWVALGDATGATTAFRPPAPGLYVFELEVDDGVSRSPPAAVSILVGAAEPGRAR